ncbi:hypothetical protein A3I48_00810 [Candidatus Daviesbacteria bacterium RIFCSPLOWO2_02_FULL_36_7]|uniref:Glucose/Sorbosone dehydrogenase domain-containing protein n=1 Tax=Candidatus Daviesbacteria bacterium RIFCSPLOWO2_02_FULL_36_7 TaxID=1797792 RepID=A0A1F5MFZ4_9BACT|nr:MAG: hypothetical protein A3I48_00810 [Candidatus Daviesbacteria bacterium RIFCSPLOWO2_02_FULL_36_7]
MLMLYLMTKRSWFAVVLTLIIGILGLGYLYSQGRQEEPGKNTKVTREQPSITQKDMKVIAQNLNIPWEVVFLPDGEILITERPGTLLLIKNKQKIPIEGVEHIGEGGLLGLAIHPEFNKNHWVYLYLTTKSPSGLTNKVMRYQLDGNKLSNGQTILQGIAGSSNHDGGRIAFDPDGYLYITTGDAQNPDSAQDRNSLNGKILRIKDDGNIPSDNPFRNAVFSYGHRNSQGLAWDDQKSLWATEHGRSGIQSGLDELNLIEKGKNYGWPVIQGDEKREGMVSPVIHSGSNTTWAPSGAVFHEGSIFFVGLRGETLYKYKIADKSFKEYFKGQFGRLRTVTANPDGNLYIITNNTDGRGTPRENDDKLIKVNPNTLKD